MVRRHATHASARRAPSTLAQAVTDSPHAGLTTGRLLAQAARKAAKAAEQDRAASALNAEQNIVIDCAFEDVMVRVRMSVCDTHPHFALSASVPICT